MKCDEVVTLQRLTPSATAGAAMTKGSDNGNKKKAKSTKKGFSPVNDLEKKLARIRSGRTTFLKAFNFLMNGEPDTSCPYPHYQKGG